MPVQRKEAEQAIVAFLRALGRDPDNDPDLVGTAARVVEAWSSDLLRGYAIDVPELLRTEALPRANDDNNGPVALHGLAVSTVCPHHLLPALGMADVLYWPGKALAGLGTLARLVDACSRRLTLQEVIGQNVASALVHHLGARGAACRLRLSHACLACRGERQAASQVETLAFAGCFAEGGADRELAVQMLMSRQT